MDFRLERQKSQKTINALFDTKKFTDERREAVLADLSEWFSAVHIGAEATSELQNVDEMIDLDSEETEILRKLVDAMRGAKVRLGTLVSPLIQRMSSFNSIPSNLQADVMFVYSLT
jgi:hypothetical protein